MNRSCSSVAENRTRFAPIERRCFSASSRSRGADPLPRLVGMDADAACADPALGRPPGDERVREADDPAVALGHPARELRLRRHDLELVRPDAAVGEHVRERCAEHLDAGLGVVRRVRPDQDVVSSAPSRRSLPSATSLSVSGFHENQDRTSRSGASTAARTAATIRSSSEPSPGSG